MRLDQQLEIPFGYIQPLQSPHTGIKPHDGIITGFGLREDEQPSIDVGLLLLEGFGLFEQIARVSIVCFRGLVEPEFGFSKLTARSGQSAHAMMFEDWKLDVVSRTWSFRSICCF